MHEMAICETICKVIEREALKKGISSVKTAKLRVGKMEAFEKATLELCLKTLNSQVLNVKTVFEIEEVPVTLKCSSCNKTYTDSRFDDANFAHQTAHAAAFYLAPHCPSCDCDSSEIITGKEMELVSIEGSGERCHSRKF